MPVTSYGVISATSVSVVGLYLLVAVGGRKITSYIARSKSGEIRFGRAAGADCFTLILERHI